jgi:hypothetical protein
MGKVYILGAGFSKSAGLPLAGELLGELKTFAYEEPKVISLGDPQENWEGFAEAVSALAERMLGVPMRVEEFPDLELLLTSMDWYTKLQDGALQTASRLGITPEQRNAALSLLDNVPVGQFTAAHRKISWLLSDYFQSLVYLTVRTERFRQQCVHIDQFAREVVQPGDTVITFNYDTLVESFLCEARKWLPHDGYGVHLPLGYEPFGQSEVSTDDLPLRLPELPASPVKVLKLHGSASWVKNGDTLLLNPDFLNYLDHRWRHPAIEALVIEDDVLKGNLRNMAAFPRDRGDGRPAAIIPTYLKTYAEPPYADLWRAASAALTTAEEVVVIGYSLPKADVAAQTLMLSVPESTPFTVVNPSGKGHYEDVLGRGILERKQTLEAWLASR